MRHDHDTVLFDLDGTVCEYERTPGEVLAVAFERAGVDPFFDVTEYDARFGEFVDDSGDIARLRADCFAAIAADHGRSPATGRAVANTFAAERDQSRVRLLDGTGDLLATLDERGYGLGLVTNGPPATQRTKLDSLDIADRFDVTVFAGHETPSKPSPEPFVRALDGVGSRPSRALFVGDSLGADIVGARAVGMTAAWVAGDTARGPERVTSEYVLESTGDLQTVLAGLDPP
jgi:HAD superfamily hydrolase (TIGR01509 family)